MTALLIIVLIACSLLMLGAWRVQQSSGNSSWVDVAWTFGTGAAGIVLALYPLHPGGLSARQIVVGLIVAVWSLRLGIHITRRALRGKDDPRYAKLRESWGASYGWKMPAFLQLQALSVFILACFIMLAARNPAPGFGIVDILALIVAVAGPWANFVVPIMVGARDMAFPRLNALSLWTLVAAIPLSVGRRALRGLDTG